MSSVASEGKILNTEKNAGFAFAKPAPCHQDELLSKVEQLEQVADCRPVDRYVRIVAFRYRVWEVIAAASRNRTKLPVPLDEFENGNMVRVVVSDVSARRVLRNNDHRDARAVAEEGQRLHETGVVVTAAFVEGDEDRRILPVGRIRAYGVHDLLGKAFEQIQL